MTSYERHPFLFMPAGTLFLALLTMLLVPAAVSGQVKLSLDPSLAKSWKDVHIARLVMQTPGRQHRLDLGPLPKTPHLNVDLTQTGGDCALVLAELGSAKAKNVSSRRRASQSSKLLVCPSGVSSDALAARRRAGVMATAKAGSRFEIRPLNNPATVRPGSVLVVRIYHEGVPQGALRVTASGPDSVLGPDTGAVEALTSPTGVARLTIPSSGQWTVRYSSSHDEQMHEALFSFDVLPDSAWNPTEGGVR